MQGKFIVLYGINNLGKSTQAKLLVDRLNTEFSSNKYGTINSAEYLKYGIYDLKPSGEMLNEYLRKGNPYNFSSREFQMCHALNRTQYEPILKERLEGGEWIIGEDYTGTGIAWGVGAGIDQDFLIRLNSHLLVEDLAILFDGERFLNGVEKNHKHEQDFELTDKVRKAHLDLAKKYGWNIINANKPISEIENEIWRIVEERLLKY